MKGPCRSCGNELSKPVVIGTGCLDPTNHRERKPDLVDTHIHTCPFKSEIARRLCAADCGFNFCSGRDDGARLDVEASYESMRDDPFVKTPWRPIETVQFADREEPLL